MTDRSKVDKPSLGEPQLDKPVEKQSDGGQPGQHSVEKRADGNDFAEYASPACFQHELDQEITGEMTGGMTEKKTGEMMEEMTQERSESVWEKVTAWRKLQRDRLVAVRDSYDQNQHSNLSELVAEQLLRSGWLEKCTSIAFFWPMQGEIDLRPLITRLVKQGKTAALPVITKRNQPLAFWQWIPGEALSEDGFWGIPVPSVRRPIQPDLLIVPMLGFDDQGHRLGFGGGYYDRSIADMRPQPICIGVCGEFGHLHSIYPQAHDIPMHAIASESQFRIFSEPSQI